jgi:hypothetical protein
MFFSSGKAPAQRNPFRLWLPAWVGQPSVFLKPFIVAQGVKKGQE